MRHLAFGDPTHNTVMIRMIPPPPSDQYVNVQEVSHTD